MISSPSSIVLSCLGSAPVSQHLPCIMLQETELCLIVVTISYSSFKQEGLHLGLRAEGFLINALIDSPDDKINSLIIGPYKVIFSSLGIGVAIKVLSKMQSRKKVKSLHLGLTCYYPCTYIRL